MKKLILALAALGGGLASCGGAAAGQRPPRPRSGTKPVHRPLVTCADAGGTINGAVAR